MNRTTTRLATVHVICRKKPVIRSQWEQFTHYLRPTTRREEEFTDSVQLFKFMGYMLVPLGGLWWWKTAFHKYPEQWENDLVPLVKHTREPPAASSIASYFDVMEDLEAKRDRALMKK